MRLIGWTCRNRVGTLAAIDELQCELTKLTRSSKIEVYVLPIASRANGGVGSASAPVSIAQAYGIKLPFTKYSQSEPRAPLFFFGLPLCLGLTGPAYAGAIAPATPPHRSPPPCASPQCSPANRFRWSGLDAHIRRRPDGSIAGGCGVNCTMQFRYLS